MKYSKPKKIRSKKITQSARGENCTLRIPSVCNHNTETVVFAHLPGNKGTSTKNHDLFGIYSCSNCHDWLDGRSNYAVMSYYQECLRALQETQLKLIEKGLIQIG
jgi:hypothetical protein